ARLQERQAGCSFPASLTEKEAEPIVPSHWTFGALVWEVEDLIDNALRNEPDPGTGPPNR
ncbi:hypothetical protein AMECASPLE_025769, partial [Ameca splendens]